MATSNQQQSRRDRDRQQRAAETPEQRRGRLDKLNIVDRIGLVVVVSLCHSVATDHLQKRGAKA